MGIVERAEEALENRSRKLDTLAGQQHKTQLFDIIDRVVDGAYVEYLGGGGEMIGFRWAGSLLFRVQSTDGREDAGIVVVARPVAEPEPEPRAREYELFLTGGIEGGGPVEVFAPPFDSLAALGEVLTEQVTYDDWVEAGEPDDWRVVS